MNKEMDSILIKLENFEEEIDIYINKQTGSNENDNIHLRSDL